MKHIHHEKPKEKGNCVVCGQQMEEEHRVHGEHANAGMLADLKNGSGYHLYQLFPYSFYLLQFKN